MQLNPDRNVALYMTRSSPASALSVAMCLSLVLLIGGCGSASSGSDSGDTENEPTSGGPTSGGGTTTASETVGGTAVASDGEGDSSGDSGPTDSDGETGGPPDSCMNGMDDDGEEGLDCGGVCAAVCPGVAFSNESAAWGVPSLRYHRASFVGHSTFDIDGDGRPDLVDTWGAGGEFDGDAHGTSASPYWQVFLNTEGGFSETPAVWSVPSLEYHRASFVGHSTFDIDGDGRPDLVDTWGAGGEFDGDAHGTSADPYWQVFLNQGDGFSEAPDAWSVPDLRYHRAAVVGHSTFDINGDGLPDLVDTWGAGGEFDGDAHGTSADPYWQVFLNSGDGFSETPETWAVPDLRYHRASFVGHSTFDINGDGLPDLVDTWGSGGEFDGNAHGTSAEPYWQVFLNANGGFSETPAVWGVPDLRYHRVSFVGHSTFDIDGDGRPDLVDTWGSGGEFDGNAHGTSAEPYWRVFRNVSQR